MSLTDYQAKFLAHELDRSYASDHVGRLAGLLFDAQVEPKPHQIDAALFALQTPFLRGVILADEVGLGKTIEAGIVMSQYWAEGKRRILIIAPSSLRQQWKQELDEKFALPAALLDRDNLESTLAPGAEEQILICSYEFANSQVTKLKAQPWNVVVCDEAHRLRSHWTGKTKIASSVAQVCERAEKNVMLTATPLQNRLEELYGLVSIFEPDYFRSLDTFRERYVNSLDSIDNKDLAKRVAQIAKRTLRKDADKYVRFTTRMPLTFTFTPSPEEQRLYDLVNSYLQRSQLWAFPKSQRTLSALIMRKRLGSSSYAIARTLENTADRLEHEARSGKRRNRAGGFVDGDATSEIVEDAQSSVGEAEAFNSNIQAEMLDEVRELREYARLARSITVNQKAVKLLEALEQGFEKLQEIGAPQKAIIFTDSTDTQEYLARTLKEAGWGSGLVLFNGSNTGPEADWVYKTWLQENSGSDLITGVPAADRRKALVDEFRERGKLMIATEAAAEGINLQFCSMLVNYDLPWNPQRIEQRIGRVHRFGQKHNVVVVNFSNQGNLAEERILELLTEKFGLFTSVFGASDEVLGQIEDGLDFEKSISMILDQCTTAEEIDAAFQELEARYAKQIDREMKKTRAKVFDNLDPKVRDKLKSYDAQAGLVLNAFERLLMLVTRYELKDSASFNETGTQFTLMNSPLPEVPGGDYYFKSQPRKGAHQYRYSSALCRWVISQAKQHITPPAHLVFQLSSSDRATTLARKLRLKSGRLRVEEVTFSMQAGQQSLTETYLLMAGFLEDGNPMSQEQMRDLLELSCIQIQPAEVEENDFAPVLEDQLTALGVDVQERNAGFYLQQEAIIDAERLDLKASFDLKINEYRAKAEAAAKAARKASSTMEQLQLTRESRNWDAKADAADDEYRSQRNRLRQQSDAYLDQVQDALKPKQERRQLFTISWEVRP